MRTNSDLKSVMVIEDSPEDFEVLVRALHKSGIDVPVQRCKDGMEALNILLGDHNPASFEGVPMLILLDLNMPGTDGIEVLEKIKADKNLRSIPTIVLSTSRSVEDIRRSYEAGANSYIPKPDDMSGYVRMANMLKSYWFDCAVLPA